MKKFTLAVLAMIFMAGISFGQEKSKVWAEQKSFHSLMAATFHPAEEGNLKPLKEKADSLYLSAKTWQSAAIPENYKPEETKAALKQLVADCADVSKNVKAGASDEKLTKLITVAHETFHKIAGECKKTDEHEGHKH